MTRADRFDRVSEAIKADHRELESYYTRIISSGSDDEKVRYQNLFTWQLARHSIAEELVVYPEMEKISGGKEIADKDHQEHQKVKELLYKFQAMKPGNDEFIPAIKNLMNELSQHIEEEENHDLPSLEGNISDAESAAMARSFERTKMFTPTRSHPSAPNKPPFETVAGLIAAPMDKLMDMFRKFPKE